MAPGQNSCRNDGGTAVLDGHVFCSAVRADRNQAAAFHRSPDSRSGIGILNPGRFHGDMIHRSALDVLNAAGLNGGAVCCAAVDILDAAGRDCRLGRLSRRRYSEFH